MSSPKGTVMNNFREKWPAHNFKGKKTRYGGGSGQEHAAA